MSRSGKLLSTSVVLIVLLASAYIARNSVEGFIVGTFIYGNRGEWRLEKLLQQIAKHEIPDSAAEDQLLALALDHPRTGTRVSALGVVAKKWPDSPASKEAVSELPQAIRAAPIGALARCFDRIHFGQGEEWESVARALRDRVNHEPEHPRAAKLLAEAASMLMPTTYDAPASDALVQIADLIRERYATSSDLVTFCESASNLGRPTKWMSVFEPHVREIRDHNEDRFVQCSAHFALATIVQSSGVARQHEARTLYQEFLDRFDGETPYEAQAIERKLRQKSQQVLKSMERHGLGVAAPDTHGTDLNGDEIFDQDYRGRVVLLSFWASWCGPCLKAVPHERQLLERFDSDDFAILGLNADNDIDRARAAVEEHGITWRSVWMNRDGFVNKWMITAYPTFCLLDRDGIIKELWSGLPSDEYLSKAIQRLIDGTAAR